MLSVTKLHQLATLIRYYILISTTTAGSGHVTSSLSATDLLTTLLFGGFFKADLEDPSYFNNDRFILSKGHAAPLLYSLYAAAGVVSEQELMTLRQFGSNLEGHPTMRFPYTEAATGSLGQGLSVGVGMALSAKLDNLPYKTFVLLGDSEMAEGSVWEAMQLAAHYQLNNLIGIIDVNRLGQRGETMYGYDVKNYKKKCEAFGWTSMVIDGHKYEQIVAAYRQALKMKDTPVMIIAKTIKGKGVKMLENKEGWHGKVLSKEELEPAIAGLGKIKKFFRGQVAERSESRNARREMSTGLRMLNNKLPPTAYPLNKLVSTRQAYGNALLRIFPSFPNMVVLDGEVSNSTYSEIFKEQHPERFLEMYIAEQNMVGTALGLSRRGKIPFVSTFGVFFARAFDQIRMGQYSNANIKFVGSHAGVAIGEDGLSQMALEDIALFRVAQGTIILYPADAVATEKLVYGAAERVGSVYIRTTRSETPVIYTADEQFVIGGSKTVRSSAEDQVTVVGAGITLHQALEAYELLKKEGILIRVVDLYSIKPLDVASLKKAAQETRAIIVVEDHYAEGGIGEVVRTAFGTGDKRSQTEVHGPESEVRSLVINTPIISLAVQKIPRSGQPSELLQYEEIGVAAIIKIVKEVV